MEFDKIDYIFELKIQMEKTRVQTCCLEYLIFKNWF